MDKTNQQMPPKATEKQIDAVQLLYKTSAGQTLGLSIPKDCPLEDLLMYREMLNVVIKNQQRKRDKEMQNSMSLEGYEAAKKAVELDAVSKEDRQG